ncbi:glycine betaine transporter ATP-binding subunit [compost metagenome]
MVSRASLIETAAKGASDPYKRAFLPGMEPIPASESLSNVLGKVASSAWPVPVVDEGNRYLGSISKSALLETLDRTA